MEWLSVIPHDGSLYNLNEMSRECYIHTVAEYRNASDKGGWCPVMRRVTGIYKNAGDSKDRKAKRSKQNTKG